VFAMPYHVSDGALDAFNIYLEQSGIPIAEFPATTTTLATALAASHYSYYRLANIMGSRSIHG